MCICIVVYIFFIYILLNTYVVYIVRQCYLIFNYFIPFAQSIINTDVERLPVNEALLQLLGNPISTVVSSASVSNQQQNYQKLLPVDQHANYLRAKSCIEELALYLKPCQTTNTAGMYNIYF